MANFLDKTIAFFSPATALKRAQASQKLRAYEGATKSRRGDGWNTHGSSSGSNSDIQRSVIALRERSIDGYKNNANVFGAIRTITNNTVGTGIMPTPIPRPGDRALSKLEETTIKTKWELFVESCDWDEVFNFYGLQSLACRNVFMQGEVFVVRQRDAGNSPVPFKIQLLSPHMVDNNKSIGMNIPEGHFIVQGVQFDSRGRKVGYWMNAYDPKNQFALRVAPIFVPKEDVLQVFYKDFTDQVRGVPAGTPSMLSMRDLAEYEDAAVMSAKVSAAHVAFTTQPAPEDEMNAEEGNETDPNRFNSYLEPGLITHLAPGEEVTFNTPPTPQSFSEYVGKNQQKNAKGYGITYEQFSGDMGNVNFSSGRMGWIEANRQVEDWQYNFFIQQFCKGVWKWFIEGLIMTGDIKREFWAEWTPQGREMLDPVKETNGLILKLKAGLISWTEACKQGGYNPDTVLAQIKKDKEMFESAGINVEWIIAVAESDTAASSEEDLTPNQAKQQKKN